MREKRLRGGAVVLASTLAFTVLAACGKQDEATTEPASIFESIDSTENTSSADDQQTQETSTRQDGERFEDTIILEGMEETVKYEHAINEVVGFEIDYDYESFTRLSGDEQETFVSVYDDVDKPENYLDVLYIPGDVEDTTGAIAGDLASNYEIVMDTRELDYVGSVTHIDASEVKGGGNTPDVLQSVYIIPTGDGCIVATAVYSFEAAEGFGRRFSYMMDTFRLIPMVD